MAKVMYGLVSEARRNRFSAIPKLSEEDIVHVWDNVSKFIEKQMALQKGVCVPGLGTFTFSQKKLDVGNNKYIQIQRPVFVLSEKFAMTHALNYTKHHTTGQIPVVQLNFAALSNETPFNRDTVESCVKEVLQALSRSVQAKRNVEFHFAGIGRLSIRESKVKMKFYKEFLRNMDGSGSLVHALSNRPGTADSVLSEPMSPRIHTSNTLVLPRITPGDGGSPSKGQGKDGMPTISEQEEEIDERDQGREEDRIAVEEYMDEEQAEQAKEEGLIAAVVQTLLGQEEQPIEEDAIPKSPSRNSHPGGSAPRTPFQTAKAHGVIYSISEPLLTPPPPPKSPLKATPPKGIRGSSVSKNGKSLAQETSRHDHLTTDYTVGNLPPPASPSRLDKRCTHSEKAGQELCYLCHQRTQKNLPIYFSEERRQRELEQDRLLQQYQQQKDSEAIVKEQTKNFDNRRYNQKVAAFNLGVSEAVNAKLTTRPTEFCRSYLFQNRPLTPPRCIKQDDYSKDLGDQVLAKHGKLTKLKREQEFLERLEQVQLAEDLALQREQYMKDKKMGSDAYRKALDTQMRYKPLPIPALEPDSKAPIFGVLDATDEKLIERKFRAHHLYQEQLEMVAQKKRDAILKDLQNQKDESDMLERTRQDIILDRALRHQERLDARRNLEDSWAANASRKKDLELEDRRRALSPGMLIHEQCDKYKRCKQCGRKPQNCGESNVWSESRYIPGSRLIV